jgi:hypothetical protein
MTPEERKNYFKEKMRQSRDRAINQQEGKDSTGDMSRATVYRKVKQVKQFLPGTPQKYAKCISTLVKLTSSPRKQKAVKECGIRLKDGSEESLNEEIVKNISASIDSAKKNPTNKNREVIYQLVEATSKDEWSLAQRVGTSAKVWRKVTTGTAVNKRRKDSISEDTKTKVKQFWLSAEISRPLPLKKAVKKKRATYLLECTYTKAFKLFKREYPEIKIGYVKFISLKPANVRHMKALERIVCCCQKCENIKLKIDCLNRKVDDSGMKALRVDCDPAAISQISLCHSTTEIAHADCLNRGCKSCGIQLIDQHYAPLVGEFGQDCVKYEEWEKTKKTMKVKGKDKEVSRIERVSHDVSVKEVVEKLGVSIEKFSLHIFRAAWQQRQLKLAKTRLRPRCSIIIMDYAENYQCSSQDEVQSAHWSQIQATIHPMMAFVNASDTVGPFTHKEAMVGISSDLKHDTEAVVKFVSLAHEHLTKKFNVRNVEHFSDCAASQYRSRFSFANTSNMEMTVNHHFFEPSHGKSSADGLGAIVKSEATKAVTRRAYKIGDARELYNFCVKELSSVGQAIFPSQVLHYENSGRVFFYVDKDEVKRPGPYSSHVKQVKGIAPSLAFSYVMLKLLKYYFIMI